MKNINSLYKTRLDFFLIQNPLLMENKNKRQEAFGG